MNPLDSTQKKLKGDPTTPLSRSAQRLQEAARRQAAAKRKIVLTLLSVALIFNAAVSYILYEQMVVKKHAANIINLTQQEAESRKVKVSVYLQKQNKLIDSLATQPELIASLDSKKSFNADDKALLEHKWMRDTPFALKVRLIPVGSATLDRDSKLPIRFAELDLIRRAELREATPPELIFINNQWMINWVRGVATEASAPVLGTLMLTSEASELLNLFTDTNNNLGEYLLLQQFPGSPIQTIQKWGSGNLGSGVQVEIPGSYLQIKFTPSAHLASTAKEPLTLWIIVIALIALASLLAVWFLSRKFIPASINAKEIISPANGPTKVPLSDAHSRLQPPALNRDVLDIAVIAGDEDILGLNELSGKNHPSNARAKIDEADIPKEIFRSYDIRGLVGSQITSDFATKLGQAIGSEAIDQGEHSIVVARDGRTHSQELAEALIKGILGTGCHVINIGVVPTPLMYFSTFHFTDTNCGVMVTASHNPKQYNGFKVVMNNNALADDSVMELRSRIIEQRVYLNPLSGQETFREIISDYIERIFSDVALAGNISIVVDAGNAVTAVVAPQLFEELGCEVTPLFCDLDGEFPNHDPDPTIEKNLQALITKVKETNADLGVAFDGDGDRLVAVTPKGDIIWPDRLLMLFAKDILARNPGADVLFDVKCSRQLNQVISSYGGRPIMWKTGHSPMKAKMLETDALIGGEYSGHIFIKDRWYGFDDGIYAMARLLEIITLRDQKIDDIFAGFPQLIATPELKIEIADVDKFEFIKKLIEHSEFQSEALITIDGLRVEYIKGWGLVRASNTSPALTLRFEADSQEELKKIQDIFKRELLKIDKNLSINF